MSIRRGLGAQAHCVHLPHLHLEAGDILAITGASGCGKSTLLESIGLLLAPRCLEGFILGRERRDVARMVRANEQHALAAVRAKDLGFVLQSGGLLPYLRVHDNIRLPRRLLGMPATSERIERAIATLGLEPLLGQYPQALSIGERQRVAFVRAIAHEPQLLLADEPTAALDPHSARGLFELFLALVAELRIGALVVSHDWGLVSEFHLPRLAAVTADRETVFEPTA